MDQTNDILGLYNVSSPPFTNINDFSKYYSDLYLKNREKRKSNNLTQSTKKTCDTYKYNTWEITGEHSGIRSKERTNVFSEAIKRDNQANFIANSRNPRENLEFRQYDQLISIKVNGEKRFYDLFDIYKNSKSIKLVEKKKKNFILKFFSK